MMASAGRVNSMEDESETRSTPADGTGSRSFALSVNSKIDFFRGLFSWLVVISHTIGVAWKVRPPVAGSMTPDTYILLERLGCTGFYWVMGFFVLSGYCIHKSIERQMTSAPFPLRIYLIARLTRILPLYYLALAFAVLVEVLMGIVQGGAPFESIDRVALIAQVFVVQNLIRCFDIFTPSWSITNELFYYLMYGILAVLAAGRRRFSFRAGLIACITVATIFQGLYLAGFRSPSILRFGLLFGLGINWFLGVWVAVEGERLGRSPRILAAAKSWPLILWAAILWHFQGLPLQVSYLICGVAFALLMIRVTAGPDTSRRGDEPAWVTRYLQFFGQLSYPTYLFHFPLMWLIAAVIARWDLVDDWRAVCVIMAVTSLCFGAVLGWIAEGPIMRWRADVLARIKAGRPSNSVVVAPSYGIPQLGKESVR